MTVSSVESTKETLACLIIDDPVLRPRYGCLEYTKLLREMHEHRFFTEIAFIPWNYKRSDPKTVRLFLENQDHYAICIHGCNHLDNEFGRDNYQEINALLSTALWRMEQHKKTTGLPYDPVIVFPQGRFSSVAMQALKDRGFLAAFNSTLMATDGEELPAFEYLQPATTTYHDFPLFLRRYPKDKLDFAADLASGRPIIIVEHHGVFRSGYKTITDLVDWINNLGNIQWSSLSGIAKRYSKIKEVDSAKSIKPSPSGVCFNAKVALRRFLSEARDYHIETNDLLTKIYRMIRS